MHVITRKRLKEFADKHADAKSPLDEWFVIVRGKQYASPNEVREDFPHASFLGGRRTVFNIGGNKYRLVVDMRYDLGRIYIRGVLTHAEYDKRSREGSL